MRWTEKKEAEEAVWKKYWNSELTRKTSLTRQITFIIRKYVFAPECAYYFSRTFPEGGKILEAGSGSAGTSSFVSKDKTKMIAFDLTLEALRFCKQNEKIDYALQGDMFHLPIKSGSIHGIWNSGVLEHFEKEDLELLLKEFNRSLSTGGKVLFFWPNRNLPFSGIADRVIVKFGLNIPRSIWDPTKKEIRELLSNAGFTNTKINTSFTLDHYIVTATK